MRRAFQQLRGAATVAEPRPFSELPQVPSVPVLGSLWTILPIIGGTDLTRFHHASMDLYYKYGPVVGAKLGNYRSIVHLFDPKDIERVFRLEGRFPYRTFADVFQNYRESRKEMFPNPGLLVLQGQDWWYLRSKVQKDLLLPERVYSFVDSMDQVACEFVDLLESQRDSATMEVEGLTQQFYKWALESIALVVLDSRLGLLERHPDPEALQLIYAIEDVLETITSLEFSMIRLWRWIETPTWKRFAGSLDSFGKTCQKYVEAAMTRAHEKVSRGETSFSVLESLLVSRGLDQRAVMALVSDVMMAGIDTTSHSLAFLLYDLAVHPDIQQRLHNDIRTECPDPRAPISRENIDRLRFLKACFKETLRLKPVVDGTVRILDVEAVVSGFKVPPGNMFIFHNAQACRLQKYFPSPLEYRPDRWMSKDPERHPFLHLPFGNGIRSCIGRRLSEQETFLLTIRILQKYRLEYRGQGEMDYFTRLVNKPDRPLKLALIPR